jgi:hypothetical protein
MKEEPMAEQVPRIATGPAIMAKLLELEQKLNDLEEEARKHWEQDKRRMALIDQFVDREMPLDILLVNIFDSLKRNTEAKQGLEREVRRLLSAVELSLADLHNRQPVEPAQIREVNGERKRKAS